MAKPTAGSLRHRLAFDRREEGDDGAGNRRSDWVEQFNCAGDLVPRGGSETVVAARLEGRNVFGVYLRSSIATRALTADWRMRDTRAGTEFAIRAVDAVTDPAWVYLTGRRSRT